MICIFFCKQKTAYKMLRSLVGSEMCIRDSYSLGFQRFVIFDNDLQGITVDAPRLVDLIHDCLLYTSDAADDLLSVDLGGRRLIQKKISNTRCPGLLVLNSTQPML